MRPFPESVCHGCMHVRLVTSARGSTFLMCREPTLPKYPPQPMRACAKRVAGANGDGTGRE